MTTPLEDLRNLARLTDEQVSAAINDRSPAQSWTGAIADAAIDKAIRVFPEYIGEPLLGALEGFIHWNSTPPCFCWPHPRQGYAHGTNCERAFNALARYRALVAEVNSGETSS